MVHRPGPKEREQDERQCSDSESARPATGTVSQTTEVMGRGERVQNLL